MKVDSTQAALLDKLKIYPFEYKMKVTKILQDGTSLDAAILDLNTQSILEKFRRATNIQTHLTLATGIPTTSSVPHSLLNGFKNLVAVSALSGFEFEQADQIIKAAKNANTV